MPLTQVNSGLLDSNTQYTGFKNRIINGAMVIDQRNAGASISLSGSAAYPVDRMVCYGRASGAGMTGQRSTVAPAGFTNSLLFTATTGVAPVGGDYAGINQNIEGFNFADLGWGTANAQTVALSFWVRSSVTGTYGFAIQNSAQNRSYVAQYTVNAANTWEYKTVTITGDTSGTWLTDNGVGARLTWDMGYGFGSTATANAWQAGNFYSVTGNIKLGSTAGATFYITGVQLEKGSTATSFDYRPYGTELALCQRYYYRKTREGSNASFGMGYIYTTGSWRGTVPLPVTMRSTPTFTSDTVTNFSVQSAFGNIVLSALSAIGQSTNEIWLDSTLVGATIGYSAALVNTAGTPWIAASAEL